MSARRRSGYAVAAVLLLMVGLMALAHGALVLAQRERLASGLEAKLIDRRLLARTAARPPDGLDSLPKLRAGTTLLASGAETIAHWSTEAADLGGGLVLLTGIGRLDGLPRDDRLAVLAYALSPSAYVAGLRAVVETGAGADLSGGGVDAIGWLDASESERAVCTPELAALDSLGARVPATLGSLSPPARPAVPSLGLLPGDSVLARASVTAEGTLHPAPVVVALDCVAGPQNWGSPSDVAGPCGAREVVAGSLADLVLDGGEGQGIVATPGSVTLRAGARFAGLVLAGGDLILEGGARLLGAARVGGTLRITSGAVAGSACAVARALRAAVSLRRPFLLPDAAPVHPL